VVTVGFWGRKFFRFCRAASGELEGAVWGAFEAELVGDAAHRPTGVEFDDGLPFGGAIGAAVEEGVEAEGAMVVVFAQESFKRGHEVFFYRGEDDLIEEAGEFGGETLRWFGTGLGAEPLAIAGGFLVDDADGAEAAFVLRVALEEEGDLVDFLEPGFDKERLFRELIDGFFCEAVDASSGSSVEFFGDPVFEGVKSDKIGGFVLAELRGDGDEMLGKEIA